MKLKVTQSNTWRDGGKRVDCTSGRARIILERVTRAAVTARVRARGAAKSRAIRRELLRERRGDAMCAI